MPALEIEYVYRYTRPSTVDAEDAQHRLRLITSSDRGAAQFVRASILHPRRTADLLLGLVDVVRSRFHVSAAMLGKILAQADPVITCTADRIRFEGFSGCCGAYARVDLLPNAIDGERFSSGTTNVDFNAATRAALARIGTDDPLELTIGAGEVELRGVKDTVIERKVKLPYRWLRGFVEVQAIQAGMERRVDISGAELRRFLHDLPRSMKGEAWISRNSSGLRFAHGKSPGAVRVGGLGRLQILETVARHAIRATIFTYGDSGATGWVLETPDSRFHLLLSPEVWRGFSGEGQVLEKLAAAEKECALGAVRAALRWQTRLNAEELARDAGVSCHAVETALAQCAVSGLVGYDLADGAYFHRELPFDLSRIPATQKRLSDAEKLQADDSVVIESASVAWVRSKDVEYRIVLDGPSARCTCPWYSKHGDSRGPCKHILAARLATGKANGG